MAGMVPPGCRTMLHSQALYLDVSHQPDLIEGIDALILDYRLSRGLGEADTG